MNAIVEYLEYQIPVTQLCVLGALRELGPKEKWRYANNQARFKCASYPRSQYMVKWATQYMAMWAVERFNVMGVRVGVATFLRQSIVSYFGVNQ